MRTTAAALALCALLPATASAGFDWGADCDSGYGTFEQYIPWDDVAVVGEIPAGKLDVRIDLESPTDVDVQLIDVFTGEEIIAWPNGLLSGPSEDCVDYEGLVFCYSGYDGDQSPWGRGNEWIEITGSTNRPLEMRAFGYESGQAWVDYSFEAASTCAEIGDGAFAQWVPRDDVADVGLIDTGVTNVAIDLWAEAGADLDIQLIDPATGEEVIAWPYGLLSGPGLQSIDYAGALIEWSGYNGIDGDWGNERIDIYGELSRPLLMRAYGYQAGFADVTYGWGYGVGESCASDSGCDDGLWCKDDDTQGWSQGTCHTASWCADTYSASWDCSTLQQPTAWGWWDCVDFTCSWDAW